ncbi:MAG: phosphatase PAP2 family protein [Bacteroidota bacterium]
MHGDAYSFVRRPLFVLLTIVLWKGTVSAGSPLQGSDNESYRIDTANSAAINTPIHEVEYPSDVLDYYEHLSPNDMSVSFEANPPLKWYTMFTKIPNDLVLFARNTFRVESLPTIGGIVGLTGVLYIADNSTYLDMRNYARRSPQLRVWNNDFVDAGDGRYQFGFIGAYAIYGIFSEDSRPLRTASQMTEAILATGVVVQVLKHVSGRESPIAATSQRGVVRPFPNLFAYQHNQPKYYAFPSGHIATTAATLTVLNENFPEVTWLQPLSYITLGAVGGSLVSKGMHWYSDLPLGVALGYSFGTIAAHPVAEGPNDRKPLELSFEPTTNSNGGGINIAVHF